MSVVGRSAASSGLSLRSGVALAVLAAALVAVALPAAARAADECRGLMVCIPVAGPWVVIPPSQDPTASASWSLTCPDGVIAGTDARVSERAVGVGFAARVGSPVGPGVTTANTALFTGRYAGTVRGRATSFRPFIGCVPAAGGGGRRTPTEWSEPGASGEPAAALARKAAAPQPPTERVTVRTATLRLAARALARGSLRCRSGERLVRAAHAVGLRMAAPPSGSQLSAVRVVRAVRGATVVASATRRGLEAGIRVEVQLRAECAR